MNEIQNIRNEIRRIHEKVITDMKPKDFDHYIKYLKQRNVAVIPSITKSNQLRGFRFETKAITLREVRYIVPCQWGE